MMRKSVKILTVLILVCILAGTFKLAADAAPIDMVYVSAGYAMMGAEPGDLTAGSDTKPYHLVFLDAYYIDIKEVTNEDYAVCVAAGACREPQSFDSKTRSGYYKNAMYAKFPVVNVTWHDAADYCAFVEKRLPTEAEWERAARGINDNRRYPWGNSSPKITNMNISLIPGDTELVNIYTGGYSPYGAADMAGNVSEWVADWYDPVWYRMKEQDNPQGPAAGTEKVVRGSSFATPLNEIHNAARAAMDPEAYSYSVGFRCAMSIRESIGYDLAGAGQTESDEEFAYINAGNDEGIFLLAEPGSGYGTDLICVVPNGAVVKIIAGPVSINYSDWYQILTQKGELGWTIASAVVTIDQQELLIR